MRAISLAVSASFLAAGIAHAATVGPVSQISISFGEDVQRNYRVIGDREKQRIERELRGRLEKTLGTATDGGRLELVVEDVQANRPTWTQLTHLPTLSYAHSYSIGGSEITGVYIAPDGARTPVKYSWYETDLSDARMRSDWAGMEESFDRFARNLKKGRTG